MKIFLDTNILKFASNKHLVRRPEFQTVNWGELEDTVQVFKPYTVSHLDRIKSDTQFRDSVSIPFLAKAGILGYAEFVKTTHVTHEAAGLPWMASATGVFFGCQITNVADPIGAKRMLLGGGRSADEWTDLFVNSISERRYLEICRVTGAFQGDNKPLQRNQALDAFHIWSAEVAGADLFLTMDYKLSRMVKKDTKNRIQIPVVTPNQAIGLLLESIGFVKGCKLVFKGLLFTKKSLFFKVGPGWH